MIIKRKIIAKDVCYYYSHFDWPISNQAYTVKQLGFFKLKKYFYCGKNA